MGALKFPVFLVSLGILTFPVQCMLKVSAGWGPALGDALPRMEDKSQLQVRFSRL